MATNNIKPFATSSSANILKDEELATRSELQTGFPFKSKADSKLVGKLMQNATAGAYAIGQFSAKYGTTDITGSDATGFATAFESALESYIDEKAPTPNLTPYLTKAEASTTYQLAGEYATVTQLNLKADASSLANYAPLANPALTGIATLNGQNVATVNQIPDTSHFVTDTTLADYPTSEMVEAEFSSYDKNIKAHIESELTGYAPITGAAFSGAVTVQEPTATSNPATKGYVDSALAAKADASALANYAPLANPAFTGTATLGGKNLVTADQIPDTSGFATKDELSGYLSLTEGGNVLGGVNYQSGVAFNADVTITGTGNYTINGENIATINQIPDITSYVKYVGDAEHTEIRLTTTDSSNPESNKNLLIETLSSTGDVTETIECAPITNPSFQENAYINGNAIATESYADGVASTKVSLTGSRGVLAGYETTTDVSNAITITSSSPDSQRATAAIVITVSTGSGEESWVKKVLIQDASTTISLGDNWFWAGGSQPTVTAPSLLILSWDSVAGIAILQTTGS